ncbi:hypothetical protein [Hymenobacter rigui]|uniref:Uncharacterized protein n=1 Tax=Hymenobacter rigui TaxID=334424 RepID=A0A428KUN7_9BACT|nr:hypothetical protein [Hymenobacter rigui]RSK50227.1 hypothetical protein EI291_06125 [Hymenobacter rigui]
MLFVFWVGEELEEVEEVDAVARLAVALLAGLLAEEDLVAEEDFFVSGFKALGFASLFSCWLLPRPPRPALISDDASDWLETPDVPPTGVVAEELEVAEPGFVEVVEELAFTLLPIPDALVVGLVGWACFICSFSIQGGMKGERTEYDMLPPFIRFQALPVLKYDV